MNFKKILTTFVISGLLLIFMTGMAGAGETLYFVLMSSKDPIHESEKFKALSTYISSRTSKIDSIKLKIAQDYPHAVKLFKSVKVNGMFAGSFVAAVLIKKELATPVVRPFLNKSGTSTYKAVVISKKGAPMFKGVADFNEKAVAYCSLASSGEIFVRTLLKKGESPSDYYTPILVKSHQDGIDAVMNGIADYAVIKDLIWDPKKYPTLTIVGGDLSKNPNNTLIMGNDTYARLGIEIEQILINLENDDSPFARKVKNEFEINGFIKTVNSDFEHTFDLVKRAHIDPTNFDFKF